jgi:hypothetical protein
MSGEVDPADVNIEGRPEMQRIALIVALAAALAIGSASGVRPASADTASNIYSDVTGDSGTAADLTKVTLTPGAGSVTVDITFSGALGSDGTLITLIDADRNAQTGDDGIDYLVGAGSDGAALLKWDGTTFSAFPHQAINAGLSGTDLTYTLTLADLGGVQTFDLVVGSIRGDDVDADPDSGMATYTVPAQAPAQTPAQATLKAIRAPSGGFTAHAGKVLHVPALQIVLTDGMTAEADSQTCTLRVKGKVLPALSGGCAWKIPKTLKGARLALTVSVTYGAKKSSRSWSVPVR